LIHSQALREACVSWPENILWRWLISACSLVSSDSGQCRKHWR